jgi:hypothetical protein
MMNIPNGLEDDTMTKTYRNLKRKWLKEKNHVPPAQLSHLPSHIFCSFVLLTIKYCRLQIFCGHYLMLLCRPTLNISFCYPWVHNRPRLYIQYKRSSVKWTCRNWNLQTSFPCGRWSSWHVRDRRRKTRNWQRYIAILGISVFTLPL